MDALTHIMPFQVTSAETDMFARIRMGALLNLLIGSAVESADLLGFGYQGLQKHKLFWVLSRISLEIVRPMKWYEAGTVETWPKDLEKILYLRDFLVKDRLGEVVCRATSGWLAVDANTKRPRRLDDIDLSMFVRMKDKYAINAIPEKLQSVGDGVSFDVQTSYFDIDLNAHVTSSRYVDWMMDTFLPDFHHSNYPASLYVNFMRETRPGDSIQLLRQEAPDQVFDFEGKNTSLGVTAFLGRIAFDEGIRGQS